MQNLTHVAPSIWSWVAQEHWMARCFSSQFSPPLYIHAVFFLFVFQLIPQFLYRICTCAGHHHTSANVAPWPTHTCPIHRRRNSLREHVGGSRPSLSPFQTLPMETDRIRVFKGIGSVFLSMPWRGQIARGHEARRVVHVLGAAYDGVARRRT